MIAPDVRTVEAINGNVPLELIFDIGGANEFSKSSVQRDAAKDDKHEHPRFDTYTYETDSPLSAHTLHGLLQRLPKTIFRVKGLVSLPEKPDYPCVLQSTGRRATLTVGQPWGDRLPTTQIVSIGSRGGVDGTWLAAQLTGRTDPNLQKN